MIELLSDFPFEVPDAEQIVNLVIRVSDPDLGLAIPERKRFLAESVCKLIDADVFLWKTMIADSECTERFIVTSAIDGGWATSEQRNSVLKMLHEPDFAVQNSVNLQQINRFGSCTVHCREVCNDEEAWSEAARPWREAGLHQSLFCIYPASRVSLSVIGFHRGSQKSAFSMRDRSIVPLVFEQVGWLHRHGCDESAGKALSALSRRERQVLTFLLDGLSKKQIASLLEISEHTVGDYVKSIFKHFNVHSRGELQAAFLAGRLTST